MLIALERLEAYRKLLSNTVDDGYDHLRKFHITAPVTLSKKEKTQRIQKHVVPYLQYRELKLQGDV
jgi:hypothetical protein